MMDDMRVALINDEIFKIGETIHGKRIVKISLEKVELEKDGEIFILSVRHRKNRP